MDKCHGTHFTKKELQFCIEFGDDFKDIQRDEIAVKSSQFKSKDTKESAVASTRSRTRNSCALSSKVNISKPKYACANLAINYACYLVALQAAIITHKQNIVRNNALVKSRA